MARANTLGKTDLSMWESSVKVSNMERVAGRAQRGLSQAISTKETILTTKSKDTGCLFGLAATPTKVSIRKTSAMVMAR